MSSRRYSLGLVLAVFTLLWVAGYTLASAPRPIAWGVILEGGLGALGYYDGAVVFGYSGGLVVYGEGGVYYAPTGRVESACISDPRGVYTVYSPPSIGVFSLDGDGNARVIAYEVGDLPPATRTLCAPGAAYAVGADRVHGVIVYKVSDESLEAYKVNIDDLRLLDAGIWRGKPLIQSPGGLYIVDLESRIVYRLGLDPGSGAQELTLGGVGNGYVWLYNGSAILIAGDSGDAVVVHGLEGWRVEAAAPSIGLVYMVPVSGWGVIAGRGEAYMIGFTDAFIPTTAGFTGGGSFWIGGYMVASNSSVLLRLDALGRYMLGQGYYTVAWIEPVEQASIEPTRVEWRLDPVGSVEAVAVLQPSVVLEPARVSIGVEEFGVSWDPVSRIFTALALGLAFSSVLYAALAGEEE